MAAVEAGRQWDGEIPTGRGWVDLLNGCIAAVRNGCWRNRKLHCHFRFHLSNMAEEQSSHLMHDLVHNGNAGLGLIVRNWCSINAMAVNAAVLFIDLDPPSGGAMMW